MIAYEFTFILYSQQVKIQASGDSKEQAKQRATAKARQHFYIAENDEDAQALECVLEKRIAKQLELV